MNLPFELAPRSSEVHTDTFDAAKLYCFSLNIDGNIGWRLPTNQELSDLQTIDGASHNWYWSSDDDYLSNQNLSVRAVRAIS